MRVGVIGEAGRLLRSEARQFVGEPDATGASWTLRDALLVALGCHRRAGPLAYWEWRELHAALREARDLIGAHTGAPPSMDVERWANEPSRTLEEVLTALDAVPEHQDVHPPELVSLRPWSRPSVLATCRLPFIPLACLVHGWDDPTCGWSQFAGRLELTPDSTSWALLDRLEPEIRDVTPPEGVAETAWLLRQWMVLDGLSSSPVRWLFEITADEPDVCLTELVGRARETIEPKQAVNT